jgi:P-type conjugative transfer protein TrbG
VKKKFLFLGLVVLIILSSGVSVFGAGEAKLSSADALELNSARIYPYVQRMLYVVYCRLDRMVDIELQAGEKFLYVGGADTTRWIVDPVLLANNQWHVNIKPLIDDPKLSTNFLIGTDRHVYHLEAVVAPQSFTPIVCWTYPQEERLAALQVQQQAQKQEEDNILLGVSLAEVNFNYQISGKLSASRPAYSWTPQLVFDDGKKTYIKMPPEMDSHEAPVLFIKDDGQLAIVNYRMKNGYFIVDRLMDEAELRSGKKDLVRIIRKK